MSKKPFYITTTLPYVNADPHIGFAMELIRADVIARAKKLTGHEVFFNTGTDEHGTKIYRKAQEQHMDTQEYVNGLAKKYQDLYPMLGLATDEPGITFNFIRTTDQHHIKAAQAFWKVVQKNGYIYKKNYSVKYCVGCELEKTESELVNGRCPLHPLQELELIEEENYFFKFSAFQQKLLDLYATKPHLVVPDFRFNEIKSFVSRGLDDFSISRLATKMPWGVEVPDDPSQVMYVWFDALVDYISAIGWPDDEVAGKKQSGAFDKWWNESGGLVQYCGKDNLRQQSAMWQAMLMAAGLAPSQTIVIDGFITGEGGLKMSKSLGNTVDPLEIIKEYGTDALRYYVLRELSPFEDSPFTMEKFKEAYNAGLANGIGNLTSRVLKLTNMYLKEIVPSVPMSSLGMWNDPTANVFTQHLDQFNIKAYCDEVWKLVASSDRLIQETEPFKLLKSENQADVNRGVDVLRNLRANLWRISIWLEPIIPTTATSIQRLITANEMPTTPLFMRK